MRIGEDVTPLLPAFTGSPQPNRVYNVNAVTLLRAVQSSSVDAIITDPPYGLAGRVFEVDHDSGGAYQSVNQEWDNIAPTDWMAECARVLKPGGSVICFGGRVSVYSFAAEGLRLGWRLVNDITWFIPDRMPNMTGRMMTESTERILWFCPDGTGWTYNLPKAKAMNMGQNLRDLWTFGQTRDKRLHPTQKPLELIERIVELFTNEGDLVVDPFFGSGTTGRAALNLGRNYIGCDIGLPYVELARNRMNEAYTPSFMSLLEQTA